MHFRRSCARAKIAAYPKNDVNMRRHLPQELFVKVSAACDFVVWVCDVRDFRHGARDVVINLQSKAMISWKTYALKWLFPSFLWKNFLTNKENWQTMWKILTVLYWKVNDWILWSFLDWPNACDVSECGHISFLLPSVCEVIFSRPWLKVDFLLN